MSMILIPHLERLEKRFGEILAELGAAESAADPARLKRLHQEHARLAPVVRDFEQYRRLLKERDDLALLRDASEGELRSLAEEDLRRVERRLGALETDLQGSLLPRDPNEDRNLILEVRAGTGGDEAGIFAGDLLRMYTRYAESRGWKVEPLSVNRGERESVKEGIIQISGEGVWPHFKFESGVHRVQRVPVTEASGRIHTSTATVAVLAEADEVDVAIQTADLRIDTYRASGAGGQHINKTDSAVRITHLPSGLVVACQDERSQIKNRVKAMRLLRSRLLERAQQKQAEEISRDRRIQVGTGERSEKIRTYNFPQDRVTDHRINQNFHHLPSIMEGELDGIIQALRAHERARLIARLSESAE